jgi:hypothetical protein
MLLLLLGAGLLLLRAVSGDEIPKADNIARFVLFYDGGGHGMPVNERGVEQALVSTFEISEWEAKHSFSIRGGTGFGGLLFTKDYRVYWASIGEDNGHTISSMFGGTHHFIEAGSLADSILKERARRSASLGPVTGATRPPP